MNWASSLRALEAFVHALAALTAAACSTPRWPRLFLPAARPIATFLIFSLAADAIRAALQGLVLAGAQRPFIDAARAVFHVEQALFIAWSAGVAVLYAVLFVERSPRLRRITAALPALAWAVACATLALSYPGLRGDALGAVYGRIHLVGVALSTVYVLTGARSGTWFDRPRRAALWLLVVDAATLAGPYVGQPFSYWWLAQIGSTITYLLMILSLLRRTSTS